MAKLGEFLFPVMSNEFRGKREKHEMDRGRRSSVAKESGDFTAIVVGAVVDVGDKGAGGGRWQGNGGLLGVKRSVFVPGQ